MRQFNDFVQLLGLFLIVLNAVLYTKSYIFNKKNVTLLYLTLYLLSSATVMIISSILGYQSKDNLHYSHIYFISQFIFLSLFYRTLFKSQQRKWVLLILGIILSGLTFQYLHKPHLVHQFNLFEIFITSLPIIIYSVIHLYNSLNKKGEYMFINSGILIYITVSTLIFILGNYLKEYYGGTITKIWMINKILYIVYLVLILVEWKKTISQPKSKL